MELNWSVIILAAGSSTRLGKPKQLLAYNDDTLLNHSISIAKNTGAKNVVVVVGANNTEVLKSLQIEGIHIVLNKNWEEGMAQSIRQGLAKLNEIDSMTAAVVFMVCDQPFVSKEIIEQLVNEHIKTLRPIIASRYQNSVGIPALFYKSIFPKLLALRGDAGAKKIIMNHPELLHTIEFPLGNIDIDTPNDYDNLLSNKF